MLCNDTESDRIAFLQPSLQRNFPVPRYPEAELTHTQLDDSRIARQGFARGLCVIDGTLIAGGSSPSTITLYDLANDRCVDSVTLSRDIRNAIHGLEVWPCDSSGASTS